MTKLKQLLHDRRGAGMTEYLILVGVIAIVGIVAFEAFGDAISGKADEFTGEVEGLGGGGG